MDLQGGSYNLQGGTGISQPSSTSLYTQPINVQPATGVDQYPSTTGVLGYTTTDGSTTQQPAPTWTDPTGRGLTQTQYNGLTSQFDTSANALRTSANDWGNNYGIGLSGSVTDYLNSSRQGQQALDERGVQAELAKKQANAGILGMVGRGIQSGGVMLAGRNAADSSASEAIARAYGQIGQRQMNDVGNQYAQTERGIGIDQGNFDIQKAAGARKISDQEQMGVNQTISDAQQRINDLNNWAATQSLPNRLDAASEVAALRSQIQGLLGGKIDQLNSGVAGISAAGTDANRVTAANLATAGTSATNPFDFQSAGPAQFNGVNPGALPIYTAPRKRTA